MTRALAPLLLAAVAALIADQNGDFRRLEKAGVVFQEVMQAPDQGIPQDLLDKANCVVVIPGLKKGAFIFGGKYGRGYLACRNKSGAGWGPPAAVRIEGGSFGLQIGGLETDVLMLVMNERGVERLLSSKFTLGGSAEVAAGPVGRTATAETDAYMTAQILTWSRSRGVFAGLALSGATLRQDLDTNKSLYGQPYANKDIVTSGLEVPTAAARLIGALNKYSSR